MKVCFLSPRSFPLLAGIDESSQGGAEAQFKTLGFELLARGYGVSFIVDDYGQADQEEVGGLGIHKVALKYMGGPKSELPAGWRRLWAVLRRIDADVYLLKTPRHLLAPLGVFCWMRGKKLIFVGQIDGDVSRSLIISGDGLLAYYLYRLGLRFVDFSVAQNEVQQKGFMERFGKRSEVIRNILSLPPSSEEFRKDSYVLWVGNSLPKKQPMLFLELARSLPECSFKMILSLTPQNPDDQAYREAAAALPNLEFCGFVPFGKIAAYFQKASLLVGTSLHEGFPNTYLQAWQYRTPVVSLHVDPDSLIRRLGLGRVSGSFDRLCSDVRELMGSDEERRAAGRRAYEYVMASHSVEAVVPQYEDLFRKLCGSSK